jgi:hypothetical protein
MFKIRNKEFNVQEAQINMCFYDKEFCKRREENAEYKLLCFINVDMNDEWIDEAWWSPSLYHNNGIRLDIGSWKELEGITLTWNSEINERGEEAGGLYVFEHEAVTSGKIEILERQENKFKIRWSGKGNIFWDDEYGGNVPFELECMADFKGICLCCEGINEEEIRAQLSKLINIDEFEMIVDNSGSRQYVPII